MLAEARITLKAKGDADSVFVKSLKAAEFSAVISPIRRTYQLLYESGSLNLTPWMPFIALLALWIVLAIVLTRRNRSWIRREFETLEALEKEH